MNCIQPAFSAFPFAWDSHAPKLAKRLVAELYAVFYVHRLTDTAPHPATTCYPTSQNATAASLCNTECERNWGGALVAKKGNVRICSHCEEINSIDADYCAFCNEATQRLYEPERLQKTKGKNFPALAGAVMVIPVVLLGPTLLGLTTLLVGLINSVIGLKRAKELRKFQYNQTRKVPSLLGLVFHSLYGGVVLVSILVGSYYELLQLHYSIFGLIR